jgi:hypothetical protein
LKILLVTVWVDAAMEGVVEVVSEAGAEGENPNMPSNGFRRLVSLRVIATGGGAS